MSDDLDRDNDRIRPGRESPMRPTRPAARDDDMRRRAEEGDDDDDDRPRPRKSDGSGAKTLLIVLAIVAVVAFCLVGSVVTGVVLLVRTAAKSVTVAAAKVKTTNDYKQVALGIHNYHSRYQQLPPVEMKTKDGSQGLSWRVAILPFVGEDALYRQFKLDEGWDSPNNRRLASQMPMIYASQDNAGGEKTHLRVFTGNRAMFDLKTQRRFTDVTDGLSNTIMFVEATDPVLWTKPDELPFDPKKPLPSLGTSGNDYFITAFGDGSVKWLRKSLSPEKLKLAIDSQDGQPVDLEN
jgi:Protein of unknown function (DUF1559)